MNPVASERGESAQRIAHRTATTNRGAQDLKDLLSLPDDVISANLHTLPVSDLTRLARLAKDTLFQVAPIGEKFYVTATPATMATVAKEAPKPATALNPKKWVAFPLESREDINHNTRRLRFKLPVEDLGLPVGMHIFLKGKIDGAPVMRAYTPVGHGPFYVEFIIKVYFPLPPKFPDGGKLTQHMESLKVGDTLEFKGPLGEFDFDCSGKALPRDTLSTFKMNGSPGGTFKHLGLIGGGSGITPCLQVAEALLKLDRDLTVSLLYANQSPEDILCQEEIDVIAKDPRVKVWYTVDRAPEGWKYSIGFINEDMLRTHLPAASEQTYIFMCGPPPMLKFACRPNLDKLGHAESHVLAF